MTAFSLKLLILCGLLLEVINPMTSFVRIGPLPGKQHSIVAQFKVTSDLTNDQHGLPEESSDSDEDEESIIDAHASTLVRLPTFFCNTTALHCIVFPEQDLYTEELAREALQPPIPA